MRKPESLREYVAWSALAATALGTAACGSIFGHERVVRGGVSVVVDCPPGTQVKEGPIRQPADYGYGAVQLDCNAPNGSERSAINTWVVSPYMPSEGNQTVQIAYTFDAGDPNLGPTATLTATAEVNPNGADVLLPMQGGTIDSVGINGAASTP
jgi:hypothetical protein